MTENEIIEVLKNEKECVLRNIKGCDRGCGKCDLVMGDSVIVNAYDRVIMALQEIQQYRAIGTVEECREVRERQRGKRVKNRKLLRDFYNISYSVRGDCPNCGSIGLLSTNTDYCNACGQKLDWSE